MDHDVFTVSSGPSRWGWLLARRAYRVGSSDGTAGRLYTRLRESADYNQSGLMMRIMGHSLRKTFLSDPRPLVVAHPSLVGMLRGHPALIYQHGELVVPDEAVVLGARTVLVPTEDAARPFGAAGYRADQVMVTGLCVELSLRRQAEDAYRVRLARMKDDRPLTDQLKDPDSGWGEPGSELWNLRQLDALGSKKRVIEFIKEVTHFTIDLENKTLPMIKLEAAKLLSSHHAAN